MKPNHGIWNNTARYAILRLLPKFQATTYYSANNLGMMKLLAILALISVSAANRQFRLFKKIADNDAISFKPDGQVSIKVSMVLVEI